MGKLDWETEADITIEAARTMAPTTSTASANRPSFLVLDGFNTVQVIMDGAYPVYLDQKRRRRILLVVVFFIFV